MTLKVVTFEIEVEDYETDIDNISESQQFITPVSYRWYKEGELTVEQLIFVQTLYKGQVPLGVLDKVHRVRIQQLRPSN